MRMHGFTPPPRLRFITTNLPPHPAHHVHLPNPNARRGLHLQGPFTATHSQCIPTPTTLTPTTTASTTTVAKGTAFENRSLQILAQDLAMDLHRVGGKNDGGVDLIGWWKLPRFPSIPASSTSSTAVPTPAVALPLPERIRIVAQCKAEQKKIGPKYIRELEGVLHEHIHMSRHQEQNTLFGRPPETGSVVDALNTDASWNQFPIIALFISESPFTKSAILRMLSSTVPLLFLHIPPPPSVPSAPSASDASSSSSHDLVTPDDASSSSSSSSSIGAALVNPALAGTRGILRGEVEIRWEWCRRSGEGRPGVYVRGIKVGGLPPGEHRTHINDHTPHLDPIQ